MSIPPSSETHVLFITLVLAFFIFVAHVLVRTPPCAEVLQIIQTQEHATNGDGQWGSTTARGVGVSMHRIV